MTRHASENAAYTVGEAAALLGVPPSTLRSWEERYALRPRRTSGGHRRYAADDLERVMSMQRSRSPAATTALPIQRLAHLIAEAHALLPSVAGPSGLPANDRATALGCCIRVLADTDNLDHVLREVLPIILDVTGFRVGFVCLLDERSTELSLKAGVGLSPALAREAARLRVGSGIAGRVVLTGDPVVLPNISEDARLTLSSPRDEHLQAFACIPLKSHRGVLGTLTLIADRHLDVDQQTLEFLSTVGYLLGSAAETAKFLRYAIAMGQDGLRRETTQAMGLFEAQENDRNRLACRLRRDVLEPLRTLGEAQPPRPAVRVLEQVIAELDGLKLSDVDVREALADYGRFLMTQRPKRRITVSGARGVSLNTSVAAVLVRIGKHLLRTTYDLAGVQRLEVRLQAASNVSLTVRTDCGGWRDGVPWHASGSQAATLALVRALVGPIDAQLEFGLTARGGAVVRIQIPRDLSLQVDRASMTRVAIVDRRALVRLGIADALAAHEQVEVVGTGETSEDAVFLVARHHPEILLIQSLLVGGELGVIGALKARSPGLRVVVIGTREATDDHLFESLQAGAVGYLRDDASVGELLRAISAVGAGEVYMSPDMASRALAFAADPCGAEPPLRIHSLLSEREVAVLQMLAQGMSTKQIASRLGIADKTVRNHLSHAYQKLHIYDRAHAVLYAARCGWIQLE